MRNEGGRRGFLKSAGLAVSAGVLPAGSMPWRESDS